MTEDEAVASARKLREEHACGGCSERAVHLVNRIDRLEAEIVKLKDAPSDSSRHEAIAHIIRGDGNETENS